MIKEVVFKRHWQLGIFLQYCDGCYYQDIFGQK